MRSVTRPPILFCRAMGVIVVVAAAATARAQDASGISQAAADPSAAGELAQPESLDKLLDMAEKDIGQLSQVHVKGLTGSLSLDMPVSTVSRQESTVGQSPAAVFVITNEMIRRSGAKTIPEVLRMAPRRGSGADRLEQVVHLHPGIRRTVQQQAARANRRPDRVRLATQRRLLGRAGRAVGRRGADRGDARSRDQRVGLQRGRRRDQYPHEERQGHQGRLSSRTAAAAMNKGFPRSATAAKSTVIFLTASTENGSRRAPTSLRIFRPRTPGGRLATGFRMDWRARRGGHHHLPGRLLQRLRRRGPPSGPRSRRPIIPSWTTTRPMCRATTSCCIGDGCSASNRTGRPRSTTTRPSGIGSSMASRKTRTPSISISSIAFPWETATRSSAGRSTAMSGTAPSPRSR